MTFTKQDALTFAIGLVVALGLTVAQALIEAEQIRDLGIETWGVNLLIGLGTSLGRYLATYLATRSIE